MSFWHFLFWKFDIKVHRTSVNSSAVLSPSLSPFLRPSPAFVLVFVSVSLALPLSLFLSLSVCRQESAWSRTYWKYKKVWFMLCVGDRNIFLVPNIHSSIRKLILRLLFYYHYFVCWSLSGQKEVCRYKGRKNDTSHTKIVLIWRIKIQSDFSKPQQLVPWVTLHLRKYTVSV